MKLEGSLDAFSLPDIFQLLSFTKKSGGLRLRHGSADGVVYFTDGFVTGASADGVRQALARRLIGSGAVDDDVLARAVVEVHDGHGVGPWLIETGAVDAELVRQAATEQTMDSVFDLLRWPAGDFAFSVDSENPDDVGVRLAPDVVVAESVERQAAWDAVASVIPGPDTVLTMPVVLAVEPAVTRDEWALLALVDGRRRVGDLVELTGCGQFAVVSTLAALVGRGLLQISDAHDHVTTVARRQALLAPLEGVPDPVAPDSEPVEAGEPTAVAGTQDETPSDETPSDETPSDETPSDDEEAGADDSDSGDVATAGVGAGAGSSKSEVSQAGAAEAGQPVLVRAHTPGDVVPARAEPFLPTRRPDHPEAPAARLTGLPAMNQSASAAVAAEPQTSGLIERDPSVNRSLLLRLIAGVRGL